VPPDPTSVKVTIPSKLIACVGVVNVIDVTLFDPVELSVPENSDL
jgi:hypothetical protein